MVSCILYGAASAAWMGSGQVVLLSSIMVLTHASSPTRLPLWCMQAVCQQPVTVALSMIPLGLVFLSYSGGILAEVACSKCNVSGSPARPDIAALVVGYGEEGGVPYWLLQSSLGAEWGEGGFFRIKRGIDCCGITRAAYYPLLGE